jgi:hypothetical protein
VHSATVKNPGGVKIGCVVYRDNAPAGTSPFRFYAPRDQYALDECALDKGGDWLVIHEGEDNRVVNLQDDGEGVVLTNEAGAHGHADLGYGYSVGADDQDPKPNATTLIKFPIGASLMADRVSFDESSSPDGGAANHVSHTNARRGVPPEQQYVCASNAQHAFRSARIDEINCFMLNAYRNPPQGDPLEAPLDVLVVAPVMTSLDDPNDAPAFVDSENDYQRRPKGSLDINGEYFIWTTNMGATSNRTDAFIVKVPARKLLNGQPGQ